MLPVRLREQQEQVFRGQLERCVGQVACQAEPERLQEAAIGALL